MLKKLLAFLAIPLFSLNVFCTNAVIDSLEKRLNSVVGSERTLTLADLTDKYILIDANKAIAYSDELYSSAVRSNMLEEKYFSYLLKSKAYYYLNDYPKSLKYAKTALESFKEGKFKEQEADAMTMIGHILSKQNEINQAIDNYKEAQLLYQRLSLADKQLQAILNQGIVYRDNGDDEKALQLFLKALNKANKTENAGLTADALNNIAGIYWKLGQNRKALKNYLESLQLRESIGDKSKIASSLGNIGLVYNALSNYEESLKYHLRALAIKTELGNENDIAYSLTLIGNVLLNLNKFSESLQYYEKALQIRRKTENKLGIAKTYDNIGLVYKRQNKNAEALKSYEQALVVRKEIGDQKSIVQSLNNIGGVYWKLDNYHKALDYFIQAVEANSNTNDLVSTAKSYNNVGLIYKELSNFDLAINYNLRALDIYEKLGNRIQTAVTYNYIGNVYWKTQLYELALENHMKALRIREGVGNQLAIASSLSNIGLIYRDMKDSEKSLEFYNNALSLYNKIGDRKGYAHVLNSIGDVYAFFGDNQKAILNYNKSLNEKDEFTDLRGTAITSLNLAQLYVSEKRFQKALKHLELARKNATEVGENELIKNIALEYYNIYLALGNSKKALENYQVYTQFKDSILNRENARKIAELQIRFEMHRKENEIASLKKQKELDDIRITYQRRLVIVLVICFVLALYAAIQFYLRLKNKKQANTMLERIFSIISHDLREPVASLTNMSFLLTEKKNQISENEQKQITEHIGKLSDSLLGLLDNLLNWTRSEQGLVKSKPEPINIQQLVTDNQNILLAMANNKNVTVKNEVPESIIAYADKNAISMVIRNLLSNALKFSFKNNEVRVFGYTDSQNVILGVEDFGKGIPENKVNNLFVNTANESELGTNDEKGTGIGLRLCSNFIKVNKGSIWVESIENKHTVFYISIPLFKTI